MEPNTITEVVKTLVWPVTLIVTVIILRDAIRQLIPGLNKLRYKDFELEFNKELSNVRAEFGTRGRAQAL